MGRPPAYIFIVRHGNRLDAADKLWHLSSPTPYDPPLTYGGWSQCRALGQRIADILRENSPTDTSSNLYTPSSSAESVASGEQARPKKRRYKIAIHSSPFLRCIQTSIAISSGISSDTLPLESPRAFEPLPPLPPLGEGENGAHSTNTIGPAPKNNGPKLHKSVMRIDAFLGEWLSPSYFELITPPPSSVLMIASAKAELLRKEDYSSFAHPSNNHSSHHHAHSHSSNQLWGSPRQSTWSRPSDKDEPAKAGSPIISPISRSGNAGADNSSPASPIWRSTNTGGMHSPAVAGYVAPVPHFALSSRAPTPSGYVAHARDACVDLDYQWDSMRGPYDWGDGGEFGEEWTAMHRRFRRGLQHLVDWYSTSDKPTEMVTRTIHFKPRSRKVNSDGTAVDDAEFAIESDEDEDADASDSDYIEESIVIIVSHGAGCNAMIGAITKEPVLMDVGLASLSVAARRPGREELPSSRNRYEADCDSHTSKWTGSVHSGHPGGIVPLDKYYEMKMFANSDHLRSVPTTPTTPRLNAMASVMGVTRGRHSNSLSGTPGNFNLFDNGVAGHRSSSVGSFHGASDLPMRRPSGTSAAKPTFSNRGTGGITIGSGVTTFSPRLGRSRAPSAGLWSPVSSKGPEEESFALTDGDDANDGNDSDMEILLSFGPETTSPPPPPTPPLAPTYASTSAPASAAASLILPKKKAPSIKSTGSRYPSSLSIAHSANGDDDEDYSNTSSKIGSPVMRAEADKPLDKAVRAGLTQLDIKAATTAAAPSTGYASPGLWAHPRVVSINSDELAHENALSKRRWTVTERPS
ncbi:phosphoglycerate mutase [Ophiostoma piceae UAMH 11346]|uniref:Phosphoglycerate mutase n=1 Tax=Ophiostoma piceae (strain UAMH 11346) TaxID=1262450 RepID=S3C435_OPHP1|nr:phosphoglycerate mutase [Ophiostoma piceae UAMH 11346]